MNALALRRLLALFRKEALQVLRDPSSFLIAFVLPVVMLFLFASAVSLDIKRLPIGVVLESDSGPAQDLAAAFMNSRFFDVHLAHDRRELSQDIVDGTLRGMVVVPQDFVQRIGRPGGGALVQIITDGSQPNTAGFVASYAQGVVNLWLSERESMPTAALTLEPRFWFNPELESRRALVPGSIAIVMTMIGTLLTAMVLAREWERGTMEAMLSTPARGRSRNSVLTSAMPISVLQRVRTVEADAPTASFRTEAVAPRSWRQSRPSQPLTSTHVVERAAHPSSTLVEHMRVHHRRRDVTVAEQFLHGANVVACLQHVCGERMPHDMG